MSVFQLARGLGTQAKWNRKLMSVMIHFSDWSLIKTGMALKPDTCRRMQLPGSRRWIWPGADLLCHFNMFWWQIKLLLMHVVLNEKQLLKRTHTVYDCSRFVTGELLDQVLSREFLTGVQSFDVCWSLYTVLRCLNNIPRDRKVCSGYKLEFHRRSFQALRWNIVH